MKPIIKFFSVIVGILILAVPVSGFDIRAKLNSKAADVGLPDTVVDQLGNLSYSIIIQKNNIIKNSPDNELADRVMQTLIQAAQKGQYEKAAMAFQWETTIIDKIDISDAKVFPGGKIIIYSGLFSIVKKTPPQTHDVRLAAVLGHEMVHALARHAAQRIDRHTRTAIMAAATSGSLNAKNFDPKTTIVILGAMGVGYAGAVAPPFLKQQEDEADKIGVTLMAQAGFDPEQVIVFFQDLKQEQSQGNEIEILANHPSIDRRIIAMQKIIPELVKN